jgi:GDP-4-dehydro-6-deoxy-D-mannose reductase
MPPSLLLIGVEGFAGRHLRSLAESSGWKVTGAGRSGGEVRCDLLDRDSLERAMAEVSPDAVANLAGRASVAESWRRPAESAQVNVLGVLNLLEAAARRAPEAHLLCVSSGEVYGEVPAADLPAREELPPRPVNPYGAAKGAMEVVCGQYARGNDLKIAIARSFNHLGPFQADTFVAPSVARRIAEAEARGQDRVTLSVGNLSAARDFTDVRDIVRAYLLMLGRGVTGIYNVCSGEARSIGELVKRLSEMATIEVDTEMDRARLRRTDVPVLSGSPERLHEATGWRAEIPLERSLSELLDWWRDRAGGP